MLDCYSLKHVKCMRETEASCYKIVYALFWEFAPMVTTPMYNVGNIVGL
jgi:hypothetical protein